MRESKLKDADSIMEWAIVIWKRDLRKMVAFVMFFITLLVASHYIGFRMTVLVVLSMLLAGWFGE